MKQSFRDYHLFRALDAFSSQKYPLDLFLSKYFRTQKAIGSKDRKWIAEAIYALIRWQGLIDHFCPAPQNWENRWQTWQKQDPLQYASDSTIPSYIRGSIPLFTFELLEKAWGEQKALDFCLLSNQKAPTTIRINPLKTSRQELLNKWEKEFEIEPTAHSIWGITFKEKINFYSLPEFTEGLFEIQDEGSQLVANLMEIKPGDQVLDFCAGAGGKTLGFAHKLAHKGQIYLHDVREEALQNAKKRLRRAGIQNAQVLPSSAKHKAALKGSMDWVLVDAPCTGSGTWRRNPDSKWKFSLEVFDRLIVEQRTIFEEALTFLKPKGVIVYATCSVFERENENQIAFFKEKCNLELLDAPFQSLPTRGGMDGFFAAKLRRM